MVRTLLTGIAAAIAMFIWNGAAHEVFMKTYGIHAMSGDAEVLAAIEAGTGDQPGLYYAPGAALSGEMSDQPAPGVLLAYSPAGTQRVSPMMLVSEFVLELIEAVLLVALLAKIPAGFGARVGWAAAVGVIAAITTNGSSVVWYHFPLDYSVAYGAVQWFGFVVAGIVGALILPRRAAA